MKPILISEKNTEKIENYLTQVNGRSKERIIECYSTIDWMIRYIDNYLKHTTKTNRNGLKVIFRQGAAKFPRAYKYHANGTIIILEYKNNKWYLTNAYRDDVRNQKYIEIYYPEMLQKEITCKLEHAEF